MDGWDKFNETSILDKEDFCSHLNILLMQITRRQKDFVKILKKNNLGEYLGFYVCSDIVLLTDVFNNFWNMCLEIYGLNPVHFYQHQD